MLGKKSGASLRRGHLVRALNGEREQCAEFRGESRAASAKGLRRVCWCIGEQWQGQCQSVAPSTWHDFGV